MGYTTIEFDLEDGIGIIRLNRPHRMNAVIEEMYTEIQQVLKAAETDPAVRAVILTGSVREKNGVAKQAFCAGADLKKHAAGDRTEAQKRKYIMLGQHATRALYEFSKPTIAAVNGPARGAGVEMALNCDFVFMAHDATVALTETSLGTFIGGVSHGGGVLYYPASAVTIVDCVITGNTAVDDGGGVYCVENSSATLINCTIVGNCACDEGGGVCCSQASMILRNCIVWGNIGGSVILHEESAIDISYSCIEGEGVWPGTGNIGGDPLFCGWRSCA